MIRIFHQQSDSTAATMPPTIPPTTPPIGFQPLIRKPPNGATGDTQQDVTDRMFSRSRQGSAASAKIGRNGIVRNRADDCQRHRTRGAIRQHPLVQTLDVSHELLGLAIWANGEPALAEFEQNALFWFRHGSSAHQLANDFVIGFLVIRPELLAQSKWSVRRSPNWIPADAANARTESPHPQLLSPLFFIVIQRSAAALHGQGAKDQRAESGIEERDFRDRR